jgi:hypothetical protein
MPPPALSLLPRLNVLLLLHWRRKQLSEKHEAPQGLALASAAPCALWCMQT